MIDWSQIKYFRQFEFNDPSVSESGQYINEALLYKLETLREKSGWPIVTHWRVGGCVDMKGKYGHAINSYHLIKNGARAIDFHFKTSASKREQYRLVESMRFGGVGLYIDVWKWSNRILPIGFHVDTRPDNLLQRWSCTEKGKYIYLLT